MSEHVSTVEWIYTKYEVKINQIQNEEISRLLPKSRLINELNFEYYEVKIKID